MPHRPKLLRGLAIVLGAFFATSTSFSQAMATEIVADQVMVQIERELGAAPITDAQLNALTSLIHGHGAVDTPPILSPVSLTINQLRAVFDRSPQSDIFRSLLAQTPEDTEVVLVPATQENLDTLADLGLPSQLTDLIASASNVNGQSGFDLANARLLAPTNDVVESSVGNIPSGDGEGGDGEGGDGEGGDGEGGDGEGGDGEGGDGEGGDGEGGDGEGGDGEGGDGDDDDDDDDDGGGGGGTNNGWPGLLGATLAEAGAGFVLIGGIVFILGTIFGMGPWMFIGFTVFATGGLMIMVWEASGRPGTPMGGSPYDPGL